MKTYLFFSAEAGLAHLTRSLAVACELKRRGSRVVFAVGKEKHDFVRKASIQPVAVPTVLPERFAASWILRWQDERFVCRLAKADYEIIRKFHPDCVIADFRPPAVAASLAAGVKTVFLTGSGGLPYGCWTPGFGLPKAIHQALTPLLQRYIWSKKRPFFQAMISAARMLGEQITLEQAVHRIRFIVPEISSYLPSTNRSLHISYVGPIFWDNFTDYQPPWLESIHPDGRTIYLSFAGTGYDVRKLVVLATSLVEQGNRVVVSASTIAPVEAFPKHPDLLVTSYLDGLEASRRVDVIVCHGGYGTMMQAAIAGKPVVAIPFNPDQLLQSLRWRELGLGECLVNMNPFTFFPLRWERIMTLGSEVSDDRILSTVESVLSHRKNYQESIQRFVRLLPKRSGTLLAADAIEGVVRR